MRILVRIAPVDFRTGIDGLCRVCRDNLQAEPFVDECANDQQNVEPNSGLGKAMKYMLKRWSWRPTGKQHFRGCPKKIDPASAQLALLSHTAWC
jgi:hypothetical protein